MFAPDLAFALRAQLDAWTPTHLVSHITRNQIPPQPHQLHNDSFQPPAQMP